MSKENSRRISGLRPPDDYKPRTDLLDRIKKANAATRIEDTLLSFVSVGVDEAFDLLSINKFNRDVMIDDPLRYANDMISDKWFFIGNVFKVDKNGDLRDGQKECVAIIMACEKKPDLRFLFHIQCGLDPKAGSVMDTGRMRSLADALKDAGFFDTNNLAATIRTVVYLTKYSRLGNSLERGKRLDNQSILAWTENKANMALIRRFLNEAEQLRKQARFFTKTAWASLHFLLHKVAKEDAEYFVNKLATGENLDVERRRDAWINALRNKLVNLDRDPTERASFRREDERWRITLQTWNAFRENKKFEKGMKIVADTSSAEIEKPR
jgi:hypothetical protein